MKIGDKETFNFISGEYILAEILENTNISMWWSKGNEICPHCKEIIEKRTLHSFKYIKIYIPSKREEQYCAIEDLQMLGISVTGSTLLLTKDKMLEVLGKSEKFKYLLEKKE